MSTRFFATPLGKYAQRHLNFGVAMTKPPSTKAEVEPSNVIPITLEDLDEEARKIMEEHHLKAYTQEMLMKPCTRTRQGVVLKSGSLPKPNFDVVSTEEVSTSIQQQIASTVDSSIATLNTKLDASIKSRFDDFVRNKLGFVIADFVLKNKASTSASKPPVDQIYSKTDGANMQKTGEGWVAHSASPTGPDGRSDRDFAAGQTDQMAGQAGLAS